MNTSLSHKCLFKIIWNESITGRWNLVIFGDAHLILLQTIANHYIRRLKGSIILVVQCIPAKLRPNNEPVQSVGQHLAKLRMKIYLLGIVLQNTDNFKLLITAYAFLPKIIGREITGDLTVKLLGIGSIKHDLIPLLWQTSR